MPAEVHDPTTPTVYLDQSTLSDAFRASLGDPRASADYRPLRAWIEHVARTANLCLSNAHILELARMPADQTVLAEQMLAWLDSLPTVWVRSLVSVERDEADYWTKIAAGITPKQDVTALGASIEETFDQAWFAAAGSRGLDSIAPFLDAARGLSFEQRTSGVQAWIRAAQEDEAATEGMTKQARAARMAQNTRTSLRLRARDAIDRLNLGHDRDLNGLQLSHQLQDDLCDLFMAEPQAMPATRISIGLTRHFVDRFRRMTIGSDAYRNALGDLLDYQHAYVAAAYCDVFTCDARTAAGVKATRVALGRAAPMAPRRNPRFVPELIATWP